MEPDDRLWGSFGEHAVQQDGDDRRRPVRVAEEGVRQGVKQAVKQGMEAGCDGGRDGDVKEGVKEVGSWE